MTTTALQPLTARQREILNWIVAFIRDKGFSPTVREVCGAFGFRSPNGAYGHLGLIQAKGWLTWEVETPRTLRPTEAATNEL